MATDVSWEYKTTAAKMMEELERTLGKDMDEAEKFMFVHGTAECRLPEPTERAGKCHVRCEEEWRLARQEEDQDNLTAALSHLNTAVRLAPTQCGQLSLLAVSLYRRSRVLLASGQPGLALRDAGLAAIKGGFPQSELYSLYSHQAQCHLTTGATFEAEKCLHRALSALDKSDLDTDTRNREKADLQRELRSVSQLKRTGSVKAKTSAAVGSSKTSELCLARRHSKYPSLSGQVTVRYCQGRGRHVTAREDVRAGTVLGLETALVSCLQEDQLLSRCLHCFTDLLAGLPCHDCSQVVFCSLECRQCSMSTHHKFECGNLHLITTGPNFLALRAVTQNNIKYFLDRRVSHFTHYDCASGTELEGDRPYLPTDSKNLFNLSRKEATSEKKIEWLMIAAYLLKVLQHMGYFEGEKKNEKSLTEEEVFIGMILSHFVAVTESNSHLICHVAREHLNITSLSDILRLNFEPQQIGFGLNPTLAFFNHSCNPNTLKIQRGNRTALIACQDIKAGAEIFDNYGSLFYSSDRVERVRELDFVCQCGPCEEDWPTYQHLSHLISDGDSPGQREKARAANMMMKKMSGALSCGQHGKVTALSAEYRRLLELTVREPHRFYFNNYMIMFYCYWIKHGNKEQTPTV